MTDVAPGVVSAFAAAVAARDPARVIDAGAAAAVVDAVRDARAAWPASPVTVDEFAAWLGARVTLDGDLATAVRGVCAPDLYWACACARGCADALAAFETRCLPDVAAALRAQRASPAAVEETLQRVRARLLVGDDGPPRIAAYGGRGALRRWVRATAIHLYLNQARDGRRELTTDDERVFDAVASPAVDPRLAHMKELYRAHFKDAFAAGVAALADRDKNLLRYRHVDGLEIDEIAAIYRAHRATVHRWLASAHAALAAATEQVLAARLGLPRGELASLRRLIASQLELSLARVLGDRE